MSLIDADEKLKLSQMHASAILKAMRFGTFEIEMVRVPVPEKIEEQNIDCPNLCQNEVAPLITEKHREGSSVEKQLQPKSQEEVKSHIEEKSCVSPVSPPSPAISANPSSPDYVPPKNAVKKIRRKYTKRTASNLQKSLLNLNLPKVLRPPNSFMIFAKQYRPVLLKEQPDVRNKNISKLLGNMWKSLSESERKVYEERAIEAAAEHKRLNPTYVYNPQEARLRKAQRDQAKQALRAQRQRKTSLTPEEDCSSLPHLPQMQHLPPLLRHSRHAATALAPSPHKVLHHHHQGTAATAAVSASVREQVMHGMVPASPPHQASPPPRFYPSVYESEAYHQNQQHPSQHHYPSSHHSNWYQYPHQQQNQPQSNGCSYSSAQTSRTMSHPGYAGYNGSVTSYMPPQHQGLLMPGSGEEEEDLTAMSSRAVNQYEVEGAVPPTQQPQQPRVEETVITEEQTSSDPDSQPLPPFQHAFGSTEIGRFAHEGFSAQVTARPQACLPSPLQGSSPGSLPWSPRGSATTQQFPISY